MWMGLNLNPHPLKTEGAAPGRAQDAVIVRTWGAACCAPTLGAGYGLCLGAEGATTEGRSRSQSPSDREKECGKTEQRFCCWRWVWDFRWLLARIRRRGRRMN